LERDKLNLPHRFGIVNKDQSEEMSVTASPCQSVLDALTDVDMPKRHPTRAALGSIETEGLRLPVYACDALVLGSGRRAFAPPSN
jgi:hypothetical protein